ncbi:siderophore-interacting protein [Microlunatus speluncae]|uniref:siderophore-interacting protein n=1 Tax=Microlunatus speluncae TaxID=2594267 RepID=UPI0012665425|nr:siderophore-interacting protein [Microlunatus speluncae]
MAQHRIQTHPIILRRVQLARVVDVTPTTRRVTLTGDQLGAFSRDGLDLPAFHSPGFDDHLKLIFAADGDLAAALPRQLAHGIEWGPAPNRQGRDYTPRRFDPAAGELDLDFVLHGDGPAARWAATARPGDDLWFAGPKSSTLLPDALDWILLAGDETALPAIGRFLDERPTDVPARVVVVITDPASEQPLALRDGDTIRWVIAPRPDGPELERAIRELDWWPGTGYAWCAGESRALLPIRRHLGRERGVPKTHLDVTGYWHADTAEAKQSGGAAPSGPARTPADLTGATVTWFAVRAAVELGLLERLAAGPVARSALAVAVEVPESRLAVLLDVLARAEVVDPADPEQVTLGRLGDILLDDEHAQEQFLGPDADLVLTLSELAPALRTGGSPWRRQHGRSLRTELDHDRDRYEELVEHAGRLRYLITGLAELGVWRSAARIGITGPGSVIVADRLRQDGAVGAVTIVEQPDPLAVLIGQPADHRHEFAAAWPPVEVAVSVFALAQRTDEELVDHLRELAAAAPRAVVIEGLRPDALSPGAAQQALLGYAGIGVEPRSPEGFRDQAGRAGWSRITQRTLGWGVELFELDR